MPDQKRSQIIASEKEGGWGAGRGGGRGVGAG